MDGGRLQAHIVEHLEQVSSEPELSPEQIDATINSRGFVVLLLVAAVVGVVVSLAAWCFLELVNQIQRGVFVHLPSDLGYLSGPPLWWGLPVLALAALIVAVAIERLPGRGGHIPANGLVTSGGPTLPTELPGVLLAAIATIGLGLVLGPEAPLIALGSGLGVLTIRLARKDAPPTLLTVVAAAGSFAAMSFLFQSPLIAAVIMIEAIGLGGPKLTLVLLPGLLAAGIGTLVSLGMGSWTGLSTSAYALGPVEGLAKFARPDIVDFGWTIALAVAVALVCVLITRGGRYTERAVTRRPFLLLPGGRIDRRRARDRLSGEHRQAVSGSPVLRAGGAPRAARQSRHLVDRDTRSADRIQGARLQPLPWQLSRRPDLSRAVSRRRRRADGGAAARVRDHAWDRRRDGAQRQRACCACRCRRS